MKKTQPWRVRMACSRIRAGAVFAYPTEGVWGLGCLPESMDAVARILRLKQRPPSRGLILVAGSIEQVLPYIRLTSEDQANQLRSAWPGPLTYVIPASNATPAWITGNHDTVAVRVSDHPVIREICAGLGQPIVSTSANPSGKPPALKRERVIRYFGDELDFIFPGDLGDRAGKPSEIRDFRTGQVLRSENG